MLLRFWDPQSGSIRIDGTDIRNVTLASLRAATAVVPQDCVLFNESLRYNIRWAGAVEACCCSMLGVGCH